LQTIVAAVNMPVNVLLTPAITDLDKLQEIGIKRVSLGPGFLKHSIKAMKDLALKLQHHSGIEDLAGNDITSDYLKNLVLH